MNLFKKDGTDVDVVDAETGEIIETHALEVDSAADNARNKVISMQQDVKHSRALVLQEIELITKESFSKGLYWKRAKEKLQAHVISAIDFGLYLNALKLECEHGEFLNGLQELGVGERMVQNYMKISRTFHSMDVDLRGRLGVTKMIKLLGASDADKDMLLESGATSFASKDELTQMSVRELEQAIREVRADADEELQVSEDRRKALLAEKRELERENKALKNRLDGVDDDNRPEWMQEFARIQLQLTQYERELLNHLPNLDDPEEEKMAKFAADQLQVLVNRCHKYLVHVKVDKAAVDEVGADRVQQIKKKHADWNLDPEAESTL